MIIDAPNFNPKSARPTACFAAIRTPTEFIGSFRKFWRCEQPGRFTTVVVVLETWLEIQRSSLKGVVGVG
jgi:hypothetical protein